MWAELCLLIGLSASINCKCEHLPPPPQEKLRGNFFEVIKSPAPGAKFFCKSTVSKASHGTLF